MSSGKTLSIWVNAYLNGKNSDATKAIDAYYALLPGITGTVDAWEIIGSSTGPMATQINAFEDILVSVGLFSNTSDISAYNLAILQWMNPEIMTNSADIAAESSNFTTAASMYQMEEYSMEFAVFPEVYFFAEDGGSQFGLSLG